MCMCKLDWYIVAMCGAGREEAFIFRDSERSAGVRQVQLYSTVIQQYCRGNIVWLG